MKNKISVGMKKKIIKSSLYIIVSILVGVTAVYAGSTLTAPHSPSKTMKSLGDLYELINTGANTPSTDFTTPATVSTTMYSLGDVYDLMTNKITAIDPATILTGTTIFGKAGSASAGTNFGIPKTGQTICNQFSDNYNSANQVPCTGTNQDGELKKGIALSYTDNGNGTVTDNATGLMWQKCADGQDPLTCAGTANTFLMDDGNGVSPAINYCESLSLATNTDWHLPNVKQLQTIVDYGRVSPAINPDYFPNASSEYYWSSTAYLNRANYAWILYFVDGNVTYDGMDTNYYVRCVRE